jgi:hypothetical protein
MGVDFIRNAAPAFNRVLDRRLVEMNSPKLFSRDLPIIARSARAEFCGEETASLGEKLLLRLVSEKVMVLRKNMAIAECPNPPAEFVAHLRAGAGIAEAVVSSVQVLSQTLEIELCE